MKKFNAFELKIFMAFLMVLDHISYFIPSDLSLIFHVITRVVGVFFAYMAVEGFFYTRNIKKYLIRLYVWSGIMFAGNTILNYLFSAQNIVIHNNIFLTMAVGVSVLTILSKVKNKLLSYTLSLLLTLAGIMFSEGGMVIIPFMIISYYTRNKLSLRNIAYVIFSVILFAMSYTTYETLSMTIEMLAYNSDFLFVFVIPFLNMYNGKRGPNTSFNKYFFYVFYPAHLWIISTIAYFLV